MQYEHDGFHEEGDEIEQLDFEDTEFIGMHVDDVEGAVEQGGAGSGSEGHMQDRDRDTEHVHEHTGSDDSMGQQQGNEENGGYVDGDQQQQDEQQQRQDGQQQGAATEEPETGEYRTDEYEEFQEDAGASADEVWGRCQAFAVPGRCMVVIAPSSRHAVLHCALLAGIWFPQVGTYLLAQGVSTDTDYSKP
jgi:hypothetical protein